MSKHRHNRQMEYWVFARPNQMLGHNFTDDVALCKASSRSEAIRKFSALYNNVESGYVYRLNSRPNHFEVMILTDY